MALRKPKKNYDYITQAQKRLELTKQWRDNKGIDDSWKRFIDLYRHKQYGDDSDLDYEDRVVVNYIYSTINVIFPSITVNHPKIVVMAKKEENEEQAVIVEAVINYWWKHLRIQKQFRRAAKDYLIVGHGWLKTCWKYEEQQVPRDQSAIDAEAQPLIQQRDLVSQGDPEMASLMPSNEDIYSQIPLHELQVNEDKPHVERVSPFDIFVDPTASDLSDARWIAQRIWKTVDEVKNDEAYDPRTRGKIEAATGRGPWTQFDPEEDQLKYDDEADYVCVWEYYDIANDQMCTFAQNSKDYLVKPRSIPYLFGHPFVMISNYEVPDHFYPMGDVEALETLQHELNLTRTQMINHRKRGNRKWLGKKQFIDNDVRAAIESDDDNVVVQIDGDPQLSDVIIPLPQVPVAPDFYNQSNVIEADLGLVSGVSEYQRGALPETKRTATEAGIIADSSNARSSDKLAQIEAGIADVAANLIALAQQYLTTEQQARVVGHNGEKVYFKFGPEEIAGEYDFDVEGGSTQPNNESFRRQSALHLMDAMAPLMQMRVVNPIELGRYVLEKGFGISNPSRFLQDPPPHPFPTERIVETIAYKDAPPDVQRQIEEQAGLQPSQLPPNVGEPLPPQLLGMPQPPPPPPPTEQVPQDQPNGAPPQGPPDQGAGPPPQGPDMMAGGPPPDMQGLPPGPPQGMPGSMPPDMGGMPPQGAPDMAPSGLPPELMDLLHKHPELLALLQQHPEMLPHLIEILQGQGAPDGQVP